MLVWICNIPDRLRFFKVSTIFLGLSTQNRQSPLIIILYVFFKSTGLKFSIFLIYGILFKTLITKFISEYFVTWQESAKFFTKNGNNFRKTCDSCYLTNKDKFKQDGWQYDYSCTLTDNNQNESKIIISIKESLKDLVEGIGMVLGGALKEMSGDDFII